MFYNAKVENYNDKKIRMIKYKDTKSKGYHAQKSTVRNNSIEKNQEQNQRAYAYKVKRRIYDYANSNDFAYFATFTFRDEYDTNEKRFDEMYKWLQAESRRARRHGKEFKYIVVPELHESGLVHFHALFSDTFDLKLRTRIGINKRGNKKQYLYIQNWKRGFTDVSEIKDKEKCANYISKYITKNFFTDKKAVSKFKKNYWASKNLERGKTAYVDTESIDEKEQAKAIDFITTIESKADYKAELKTCTIYELSLSELEDLNQIRHYLLDFDFYDNKE